MRGDVDVEKPASLQAQHDEHIEQPEGDGRHDREVDGDGFPEMILEESPSTLRGRLAVGGRRFHTNEPRPMRNGEAQLRCQTVH